MKPTEQCRGEPERQFQAAFGNLPVGVAHLDPRGRLLRANPRFVDMTGRPEEALPGLHAEALVSCGDLWRAARLAVRLRRAEIPRGTLVVRTRHPEGGLRRCKVSLSLAPASAGYPVHFIVVADESDPPEAATEGAPSLQEQRLCRALDAARMDVFEYEPLTGQASRQGPLCRLLGLRSDARGADFFALIHPEDRPGLFAAHEGLCPEQPDYIFEFRVLVPGGATLWLVDRARGHFDARRRLVRVVGICADITQHKEAAQALSMERELLRQTLDSIPVMLCLFDAREQKATLNRHFENLLGWGARDLHTPEDFLALLYPREADRDEAVQTLHSSEPSRRETTVTAKDGTRIPCEWNHIRLTDGTKIIIGWDLRERRSNEERLARHAERQALLLELTSGMLQAGHDEAALARSVFERIGVHLGADICFNYRADTPTGALHLVAGFGIPTEMRSALQRLQPGQSLSSTVAANVQSLSIDESHLAGHESGALMRAMGVRAYVGHPLYARDGRVLGTFALASTRRGAFTTEEVDFFQTVCHFVTLAWKRIQSERELHKREQQYRMALDVGQLGNWRRELLDSDVYHLDAQAQAHYGFDHADVPALEIFARVHPEDLPRVEQFVARARSQRVGHASQSIEYRVVHPDGSEHWLAVHARLVLEQRNGAPVLVRHGISADITERKRTEQALQEAMADLHRAQAVAGLGSWRIEAGTGQACGWSDEARRMLGVPAGRRLDFDGFLARVHPQDRLQVQERWQSALREAESFDLEHRIVVGAQQRWVRHKAELEFDRQGRLLGGLATLQDITERKKAEDALRESEACLRVLADSMPQLVWRSDAQGNLNYVNRQSEVVTGNGFGPSGAIEWEGSLHPEDLPRTLDAWQQAVRGGTLYEIEHRVRHCDGSYHWYLSRALPVRNEAGHISQWYGTSTDIHARKQAEAAAQEAAARMQAIVETAVEGILTVDHQGCVDSVNPAIERLFGYSAAELLGQSVLLLIPELPQGGQVEGRMAEPDAAWLGTLRSQGQELQGRRKDGSRFPMELSVSVTPLPSRQIFTLLVRDATERKAQEHALRCVASDLAEADRCKDQFLATLAHELRNPLGPLRNAAQLMRFKGVGEASLAWCAHAIDRQVRHLARLIEDLVDASRVSHNVLELRRQRLTLREVIEGAVEGSQSLIEQQKHRLEFALPEQEIALEADPVRLVQVFQNLLDNAAKYTPAGGHIELSACLEGDWVAVSVRDNGIGIPPENRAHLFEMFYQVDRHNESARSGLGIGLTLVQRLVQLHGGTIEVHSEGVGRGSTFTVRLPVLAPPACPEETLAVEERA